MIFCCIKMKPFPQNNPTGITQEQVAKFYERIVFPSKTSHKSYEELVPKNLASLKVGDFGCGQSLFVDVFKKLKYESVFLDISINALETIDYGEKIQASLTDIPLKNGCMDVIFCIGVVHHIPKMKMAILELIRVLQKGGKLYLGVYNHKSIQAMIRKLYDYTRNAFLKKSIFSVVAILIWIKNRKNSLQYGSFDHLKRIEDLLETPLVRYLPPDYYAEILNNGGCHITGIKKISSMNVLIVKKLK